MQNENEDEMKTRRFSEGKTAREEEESAGELGKAARKVFGSLKKR